MRFSSRLREYFPYILILVAGIAFHAWTTWMWPSNFDSDEAIPALMAKRMMEAKEFPIYFYGHNYGGSLSSVIAIPFMLALGKNVIAVRISVIVFLVLFYVLHALFVHKAFGRNAAAISLIYLIFPGFSLHTFISRFSAWCHIYLFLWIALLLLYTFPPKRDLARIAALFVAGVLIGMNLWVITSALLYLACMACAWLLASDEWKRAHTAISTWFNKITSLSGDTLFRMAGTIVTIAAAPLLWTRNTIWLQIFAVCLPVLAFLFSARKGKLLGYTFTLFAGFAAGNFPQWYGWFFLGIAPDRGYHPQFPTIESLTLVVKNIPFVFLGMRPWSDFFARPPYEWFLAAVVMLTAIAAIAFFVKKYGKSMFRVVSLAPIEQHEAPAIIFFLLFTGTWIAMLGLTFAAEGTVRYMVPAYQAFAIFSGVFLAWLLTKSRLLGSALLVVWIAHFCVIGFVISQKMWRGQIHQPTEISAMEQYLQEQGVTIGYADFWDAYTLNFLTEERLTLSGYEKYRFPPYHEAVQQAKKHAYLLHYYIRIPAEESTLSALTEAIRKRSPTAIVLEDLPQKKLLSRTQIGTWDIWIVED